jgi:hypothetical protein
MNYEIDRTPDIEKPYYKVARSITFKDSEAANMFLAATEMYAALKGILLVAIPLENSTFEFEKTYIGAFKVLGNRLEQAVNAINKAEGK